MKWKISRRDEVIADVRPVKWFMRFRLLHLILLTSVVGLLISLVAPIVVRHSQTPLERFNADLRLQGYSAPRMIARSSFDAENRVGFCLYYVLAYKREDHYLLRHAYFDPDLPWYVRNWHPLTSDTLKRFGFNNAPSLSDRLFDHRPTEDELKLYLQPLRNTIDEPKLVLQQLDY